MTLHTNDATDGIRCEQMLADENRRLKRLLFSLPCVISLLPDKGHMGLSDTNSLKEQLPVTENIELLQEIRLTEQQ